MDWRSLPRKASHDTVIRNETEADYDAIWTLTQAAFASSPHSPDGGKCEANIVSHLRRCNDLTRSLVAEDHGQIIGHVALSPVTIDGEAKDVYALGPISVRGDRQRQGVGSLLVCTAMEQLESSLGARGCILLGNPKYYSRFGFSSDHKVLYDKAPAENLMILLLNGSSAPTGRLDFHPAFES